jgi:hypothetical protein
MQAANSLILPAFSALVQFALKRIYLEAGVALAACGPEKLGAGDTVGWTKAGRELRIQLRSGDATHRSVSADFCVASGRAGG